MKEKMNMINQMNEAWSKRCSLTHEKFEEEFRNLMSHGFVIIDRVMKEFCDKSGHEYEEDTFYAIQRVIISIIKCDNEFLQGEYDGYVKYCTWAHINPLSVQEVNELYPDLTRETLTNDIKLITATRDIMDPSIYSAFVLSLCYLSLMGDKSFDENEYHIIRCFYEPNFDYVPSTWEDFKKEWA